MMNNKTFAKEQIIVVGIGEIAQMAYEYFTQDSAYVVAAFVAEAKYLQKKKIKEIYGCPVVSIEECTMHYPVDDYKAFVAMGYGRLNHDRERLYNKIKACGYELVSYVSSKAFIGCNVVIGENCFILENNVLQRNVHIGNDVTLWGNDFICHGTRVEDHVFVSANVSIAGFSCIGAYTFLGIRSCVIDNIQVAANNLIGAGVTITRDTEEHSIFKNSPVKAERLAVERAFKA